MLSEEKAKHMKLLRIYILLLALTTVAAGYTVAAQDTTVVDSTMAAATPAGTGDNGYTSQTSTTDHKVDTGMTVTGAVMVGLGILIIGAGIYYMVRNRRKTIGGIQSQDKGEPTPRTTDSINNPGAGV